MGQTANVDSDGSTMNLYVAEPQGDPKGAVIVFQEAFGVNDHIKAVTDRFAGEGYLAVAPHLFHRSGDPIIDYARMQEVMPHIATMTAEGVESDIQASIDYLTGRGFTEERIGVVGFCMGGTISLIAGKLRKLGAAVTYYGGGVTAGRFGFPPLIELAPKLQTPWLGLYGDADQSIPMTEVEVLREEAAKSSVPTDVVRYEDADHGFNCDERPASYNEGAARDAWGRATAWLGEHLK